MSPSLEFSGPLMVGSPPDAYRVRDVLAMCAFICLGVATVVAGFSVRPRSGWIAKVCVVVWWCLFIVSLPIYGLGLILFGVGTLGATLVCTRIPDSAIKNGR